MGPVVDLCRHSKKRMCQRAPRGTVEAPTAATEAAAAATAPSSGATTSDICRPDWESTK